MPIFIKTDGIMACPNIIKRNLSNYSRTPKRFRQILRVLFRIFKKTIKMFKMYEIYEVRLRANLYFKELFTEKPIAGGVLVVGY